MLLAFLLIPSCGYGFGARLPDGVESLEVPVFENATLLRGLEFELTSALTDELKSRTGATLVTSGGDARLHGTIVNYEKVPVYESAGEVLAGRITVVTAFELTAGGSGEALRERTLQETQDFDSRAGVTEADARRKAVRELARRIVYEVEAW